MSGLYSAIAVGVLGAYAGSQDKSQSSSSSGTSQGTSVTKSSSKLNLMDAISKGQLDEYTAGMSNIVANQKEFDPTAAAESAQGVVKNIFDTYQKTALPQIANMSNRGGSYDSTAHQLMANDAYAKATSEASSAVLSAVQKAQALSDQKDMNQQQMLMQALQLQAQATQSQSSKTKATTTGFTTSEGTVTQPGNWATGLMSGIGMGLQTYSGMAGAA